MSTRRGEPQVVLGLGLGEPPVRVIAVGLSNAADVVVGIKEVDVDAGAVSVTPSMASRARSRFLSRRADNPNAIDREQQSRRIDVGANVEGEDLGSIVDAVENRLQGVSFPRATTPRCSGSPPS